MMPNKDDIRKIEHELVKAVMIILKDDSPINERGKIMDGNWILSDSLITEFRVWKERQDVKQS